MGKVFSEFDASLRKFIAGQKMFFVATAPLAESGHVNLSPKGLDTFLIEDERTVVYADYVGSGVETIAHLKENGRIVLMFCAFEGPPKIVRLHGRGDVIESWHDEFASLCEKFPHASSLRAFIRVHCERISDSCGFGVPLYEFQGNRSQLDAWVERKGDLKLADYQRQKNAVSIDGLPGVDVEKLK